MNNSNASYHLHIAQQFYLAMRAVADPDTLPLFSPHANPDTGLYRYDENGIYAIYLETSTADTLLALFARSDDPGLSFVSIALIVNGQVIEDDRDPRYRTGGGDRLRALDSDLMRRFAELASERIVGPTMDGAVVYVCGWVRKIDGKYGDPHYWTGNPDMPFSTDVALADPQQSYEASEFMAKILEHSRELVGVTDPECVFTGMTVQLKEEITNHAEPTPEELMASAQNQLR